MPNKRKNKAQRMAEQRAALFQRVKDVYAGAGGRLWNADDFATAADLALIVPALRDLLGLQQHAEHPWQPHCLEYFNDPLSATDFLFAHGYRA